MTQGDRGVAPPMNQLKNSSALACETCMTSSHVITKFPGKFGLTSSLTARQNLNSNYNKSTE
jgi:hypothetical protein